MSHERNNNRIVPFNSYILIGSIENVTGFKVYEGNHKVDVFRGHVVAAPFETEKALNQGEWIYFRADIDVNNEIERMFPPIECNNNLIAGVPFLMVTKDKILFVLLESRGGLVIPKLSLSGPTKVQ
jgi:hypothetical protein